MMSDFGQVAQKTKTRSGIENLNAAIIFGKILGELQSHFQRCACSEPKYPESEYDVRTDAACWVLFEAYGNPEEYVRVCRVSRIKEQAHQYVYEWQGKICQDQC